MHTAGLIHRGSLTQGDDLIDRLGCASTSITIEKMFPVTKFPPQP